MCAEMNNLIDQRPRKASLVTPMEEADLSRCSARGTILCVFLVDSAPPRWMLDIFLMTHNSHQPSPPQAPLILLASCISRCIMVTRLAWIAQRFVSSKR